MFTKGINYSLIFYGFISVLFLMASSGVLLAQNIVSNSDFEMGDIGELPEEWLDQEEGGAEGNVILTDKEAHSEKQSLLIENTNDNGYIHPNKSIDTLRGDYVFSFWAKSDKDIRFPAQIYSETDWSILFDVSCSLKADVWTEFKFPVSFTDEFPASIQIGLTSQGRLWLDDVALTKIADIKPIADIQIWDTLSKIQDSEYKIHDTSDWKILSLETPVIQGDAVLENEYFFVAFCSEIGKVIVYSKSGEKRTEIMPIKLKDRAINIKSKILENTGDKSSIKAHFITNEDDIAVTFLFSKRPIIEIKSDKSGMSIFSPIEYGIVPSFISDDLIFDPKEYKDMINIPSENLFLELLSGEDSMLFVTLPFANQDIRLIPDNKQLFGSVEIENDGQSIYISLLEAPSIWHKEILQPDYLESDIAIDWERPFPAKWITQLYEDGVKTTYTFKDSSPDNEGFWRAAIGWYTYPVWFDEDKVFFHLGKKILPKGDAIIYFLERMGTPIAISTPVDIIKLTLDTETCNRIIDPNGRHNRSLTRPDYTVGTATCEVTDAIKRVFEAGEEMAKIDYIKGGTEDMIYFLYRENERAMEYQAFADKMIKFLDDAKKNNPEQTPFLDKIESITRELYKAYEYEKEHLKDQEYAKRLAMETVALTRQKNPDNLAEFQKLKEEWTGMGGSVDDLNRILHSITRKLFQEVGYGCVDQPEKVRLAEEIRKMAIECLRNPGGYEIWSDY